MDIAQEYGAFVFRRWRLEPRRCNSVLHCEFHSTLLLIVIAIAGLVFGHSAAQNAISAQLGGLMGQQTAEVLQSAIASAAAKSSGIIATLIGIATLIATHQAIWRDAVSP